MAQIEVTSALEEFGSRELGMAADLLKAMAEQGLPKDFYKKGVHVDFNPNSGWVFLTNSEYEVAVLDDDGELVQIYNTWYSGIEGTLEELLDDYLEDNSNWHQEDIEHLIQILENNDKEDIAERIKNAEGIE